MRALIFTACLTFCASPAFAQDYRRQATAASELQEMCGADAGQLWNTSLCGPLIVVEGGTRQAWATQRDNTGVLVRSPSGAWVGTLPTGVAVANATVDWGGVRWIMVVGPLPEETTARRVLIAHEAWHRVQSSIGLPMHDTAAAHLETERGRYLLRLELRALATAMLSNGRARRNATKDALAFRMARLAAFPDASAAESALDRNEGLASYTGVRLGAGEEAHLFAARTLDLYDQQDTLARSYAYASGPAYGLLLDQYVPNWRDSLAAWAPADLLVSPLRAQQLSARNLVRRAERYGGPDIATEERTRAENQRRLIADITNRYSGPRLELPLGQMQFEFNPNQVTPIPGLGTLYQQLVLRDAWGEIHATEGALISPNFNLLTASQPNPGGLTGPGWTLSLAPGYRIGAPDAEGVLRPEFAAPAQPETQPTDN
ncbi:MAG: hypothetical protein KF779_06465 [Hyphomonadaceae bacterium]|nr:hypothetical protein [Hyphomonadaceae bacterium]